MLKSFSTDFIRGANADLIQSAQHIQKHKRKRIGIAEGSRIADGYRIKPTTTAWSTRDGAIFFADFANLFPYRIGQFGRERAATNAGCVSFADADDFCK